MWFFCMSFFSQTAVIANSWSFLYLNRKYNRKISWNCYHNVLSPTVYSTQLHFATFLIVYCDGGCWDWTQYCSNVGINSLYEIFLLTLGEHCNFCWYRTRPPHVSDKWWCHWFKIFIFVSLVSLSFDRPKVVGGSASLKKIHCDEMPTDWDKEKIEP